MDRSIVNPPPVPEGVELRLIGDGSHSKVYKCKFVSQDGKPHESVIKCISHPPEKHIKECENLKKEYQIITSLKHSHILQSYKWDTVLSTAGSTSNSNI